MDFPPTTSHPVTLSFGEGWEEKYQLSSSPDGRENPEFFSEDLE
jgi:hypothetical protein